MVALSNGQGKSGVQGSRDAPKLQEHPAKVALTEAALKLHLKANPEPYSPLQQFLDQKPLGDMVTELSILAKESLSIGSAPVGKPGDQPAGRYQHVFFDS
ncbi:predicted protein [Histoplasma capsulatum var. duboisii H88]|uniref:Predicted protein n=2 Tax=Ajellomyces capsulatus TaxID=5037 RepID=F0U846_AJEC8|nr:predicted protein [Histoplasma capsulatum H143]EGC41659.1 predicted protein [Histoplasma capsulatum var. duboisii H88]QSS51914.1 hypothetical protein I7I53_07370 [Histoplasma capsulatum var. duboisii H88]